MPIRYSALSTETAAAYRAGARDANGQAPERHVSGGVGYPCRHCLDFVPEGAAVLILAHRPFHALQPYAETGPIFLCADECERYVGGAPAIFAGTPAYLIKGYGADHRIVYGTGRVVPTERIEAESEAIFSDERVAYIHVRSAKNNCYQLRIDRA
jgi:hypothetical protein